jgi:hypothetical protein
MFDGLDTQSFACKKNIKVKKGQGIYCKDLIFAHMLLQRVIHMQKVLRINYDMILACLMDWILNPLNTLILKPLCAKLFYNQKHGEVYIARSQHLDMTLDHDILHMQILLVQNDHGIIYGCDSWSLIILGKYFAQTTYKGQLENNLHVQSTFSKSCFEMIILVFNTPI